MADHVSIGDLVKTANVLSTLDDNPPPMDFNADFNISKIPTPQIDNGMTTDFGFLNKGPSI
jgi:hypothetical protein